MPKTLGSILAATTLVCLNLAHAQDPNEDLLTFANGVLFVSQTGLASGSSGSALLAIDGDPYRLGLSNDGNGPVTFVYQLPALTQFETFGIPNVIEQPGNVTFVKNVVVSGSATGPDSGYQQMAAFELETHGPDETVTWHDVQTTTPVRWLQVTFDDGINIEPGDEGRTVLWFSELIGLGVQDPVELSTAYTGEWRLKLTERLDLSGLPFALQQTGSSIRGCYNDISLSGSVNGPIARLSGEAADGSTAAMVLVADENDSIRASVAENGGRFRALTAVTVDEDVITECEPAGEIVGACGTNAYIKFDYDSAAIRPESAGILDDVYAGLVAEDASGISIVGHTSTEGDDAYNLELSGRRAQTVADALVARGLDPGSLRAIGLGESQPLITPDASATARELNRRVAISCESRTR